MKYSKAQVIELMTNKKGGVNSTIIKHIKNDCYKDIRESLIELTPEVEGEEWSRRYHHLVLGITEVPVCLHCGGNVLWRKATKDYPKYCSSKCCGAGADRLAKVVRTKTERYGENYVEILLEKSKVTNREKYGVDFPLQNKEIKDKTAGFTPESRALAKQRLLDKYGVASGNAYLDPEVKAELDRNVDYLHYTKELALSAIAEMYGVSVRAVRDRLSDEPKRFARSMLEVAIYDYILGIVPADTTIIQNDREQLKPKEIDVWLPGLGIGIEAHGLWFHGNRNVPDKNAQLKKLQSAEQKGIRLIQLYESDFGSEKWKGLLLGAVGEVNVVYARNTVVKEPTREEVKVFLDEHHMQGFLNYKVAIGLYHDGSLIQVMTFGKPRFNNQAEWELLRLATKTGVKVIGGSQRLFSKFIKATSPLSVVSYCDKRLFTGDVYSRLGFERLSDSAPNYWYFKGSGTKTKLLHRANFQKHKLEKVLDTFDPDLTEWENMKLNKWNRIYDCGNQVWIWNTKKAT